MTTDDKRPPTGSSLFDDDFYSRARRPRPGLSKYRKDKGDDGHIAPASSWGGDVVGGYGGGSFRKHSCYRSHPVLEIGGGKLYGGNYRDHDHLPVCDLYIALERDGTSPRFDPSRTTLPSAVTFYVPNMGVPQDVKSFRVLVETCVAALAAGKSVHIACIGGHGRTGMMIAAIVARIGITTDAINWVRANYCAKAVESPVQERFLAKHYGVIPVDKRAV